MLREKLSPEPAGKLPNPESRPNYDQNCCLNYLIEMTCASPEKIEWVYNYKNIESTKDLTKNWSRGLYHQKGIKLSESDYNKNFKWVQNWFNSYFINKLGSFI